jgi:hypothetical protein
MNIDFFTQLEAELGGLTHDGAHLGDASARKRRRLAVLVRRGIAIVTLAIALAASFDSEFPATASGRAQSPVAVVRGA